MRSIPLKSATYGVGSFIRRASRAAAVMACGLAMSTACNGSDVVRPETHEQSAPIEFDFGRIVVGSQVPTPVRLAVRTSTGSPVPGVRVRWTAGDGGSVSSTESVTNAAGIATVLWTLGTSAGPQSLIAHADDLDPVLFGATAIPDKPARIDVVSQYIRLTTLGDTAHIEPTVVDRFGNPTGNVAIATLETSSNAVALQADQRSAIARNRGTATVRVSSGALVTRVTVDVDPLAPHPDDLVADTIVPGVPFTISGNGFPIAPDLIDVTVAGVRATVLSVSRTNVEVVVPTGIVPCRATGPAEIAVTVADMSGLANGALRVSTPVSLAVGESVNLLDAEQVRCAEIMRRTASKSRYIVAVINTNLASSSQSSFMLQGAGAGAMSNDVAINLNPEPFQARLATVQRAPALAPVETDRHEIFLEKQRNLSARYGSPARTWSARRAASGSASIVAAYAPRAVGDTVVMKALYNSCLTGRDVTARVVYVGTKSVVLEDVAAQRAGTMDAQYREIGREFDDVQYPILQQQVGDPLAFNGAMGGDGRVTMLFTRYVNDSLPGIAGYVTACNLYPRSTFAASQEDEVFYARVAASNETPDAWRRSIRSTVIHESKHLASFAERFAASNPFEETWLEESTARIAEELYSRTFDGGGSWKGNTGYAASVRCEVYECDDRPLMMWKHFSTLHQYYRGVDTLTPLGAAASGDFTYYASGWSFVRWAADQYATNEAVWLKALVRGGALTGLSNLAQRTGRPVGEMLADWALANAVDDLPGFVPKRSQLSFPSWNVRDIMGGLSATYPGNFVASPLKNRAYSFGQLRVPVTRLRAFSTSYFTFDGTQSGSQMLELLDANGGAPPSSLRLAIVRVE